MIKLKYISSSFLPVLFWLGFAQAQQPLSLSEAIQIGLEKSYQIRIAETNFTAAENNNDWVIAGKYPTVSLNLNNQNGFRNVNNPISFIPELYSFSTGFTPSVNANLILFDGYRIKYNKQRLEQLELQSEQQLSLAVEATIQEIMLAYYQALLQKEQVSVLKNLLDLSRDRLAYEEARQEFGQTGRFDYLQAQDAFLNDSTTYLLQKTNADIALRNLILAMGLTETNLPFLLTDILEAPSNPYNLDQLRQKMLDANRQLKDIYLSKALAETNTQITKANRYPTVGFNALANYDWSLSSGEGTTSTGETRQIQALAAKTLNFGINFTVSYTLFDWGLRKINEDNAELQVINTQNQIDDLKLNLDAQLHNAFLTYQNQKRLLDIQDQLLQNASQNIEIAAERFKGGLINSFDYRTIQLTYQSAAQNRLNAIFSIKQTEIELLRLTGGIIR